MYQCFKEYNRVSYILSYSVEASLNLKIPFPYPFGTQITGLCTVTCYHQGRPQAAKPSSLKRDHTFSMTYSEAHLFIPDNDLSKR